MKTKLLTIALLALVATPAYAADSCLRQDQIYNWKALDNRTLIVENDFHKKFKLTLMNACQNLLFNERLGFRAFGGTGLSCITPGDDVYSRSETGHDRCVISKVEAYTAEMQKADEDAAKAKKDAAH